MNFYKSALLTLDIEKYVVLGMEAKTGRIICQCIPVNRLSPLEPHSGSGRGAGNSSRNDGEEKRHAVDIQTGFS
jgi:hypothetical protein